MSRRLIPPQIQPPGPQNDINRLPIYPQASSDGDSRVTKRPRASRPKVKSGCITCKTRRVKCDETKPQCLRCQRFGRKCDGYLGPSSRGLAIIPIKPRIPTLSLYSPTAYAPATEEEHRYFQIFRENSAIELSGFFSNEFWTSLVLQESDAMTPVRHAVIAMGALNKSLESAPGPHLKVNVIQEVDKRHHENAVIHYLKAIQSLNQYISTSEAPQLRVALISCLLFICFETFQGSFASSVQQTYGGLKILRSYYSGKPGSRPWIPRKSILESSSSTSGNVNQAVQIRLGCDDVSKERTMALHLEEYLESENTPHVGTADRVMAKGRRPPVQMTDSQMYDPLVEQVSTPHPRMTETDFNKEKQRGAVSLPSEQHSVYLPASASPMRSIKSANPLSPIESQHSPNSEAHTTSYFPKPTTSLAMRRHSSLSHSEAETPAVETPPSKTSPDEIPAAQQISTARKRPFTSRSPTPSSPPILQNDLILEETLIQTFVRLDGQGLFFGMIPGIPPLIWDIHQTYHLPIPEIFDDYPSAQRCWDFLMDRTLQFYRRTLFNRSYAPGNSESPAQVARQHAACIQQLSKFGKAFKPILEKAVDQNGTVYNAAALIISLYQRITIITLATVRTDSEMVYDTYLPDFQYIIKTCSLLIANQNATRVPRNTRFSFEVGIVPPLHVTASKCRDPVIRREAVELLFASPRQEGMWDGVLAARIGKWLTSCEEDGLAPPPLVSRESTASRSPPESGLVADGQFNYPSPPQVRDDVPLVGGWENGKRISHTVNEAIIGSGSEGPIVANRLGIQRRRAGGIKAKTNRDDGWTVPEEHRVQLMVVDFHIPDRYIKVKCQKALLREDGSREERETVIAW